MTATYRDVKVCPGKSKQINLEIVICFLCLITFAGVKRHVAVLCFLSFLVAFFLSCFLFSVSLFWNSILLGRLLIIHSKVKKNKVKGGRLLNESFKFISHL